MSDMSALSVLALLGFAFGLLASRHEFDGGALVLMGVILAFFLPAIGAMQHFWWGWPWWPVVIPAHAVTVVAGILWFGRDSSDSTRHR